MHMSLYTSETGLLLELNLPPALTLLIYSHAAVNFTVSVWFSPGTERAKYCMQVLGESIKLRITFSTLPVRSGVWIDSGNHCRDHHRDDRWGHLVGQGIR